MSHAIRLHKTPLDDDPDKDFFAQPYTELFCDQYGKPYLRMRIGDHFETHPLRGKWVLNTLIRWNAQNGVRLTRRKARCEIDYAEAFASEQQIELTNRSGWGATNNELWIDLGDEGWRAAKVTPYGWEVASPPIMFQRFAHQRALPDPILDGNIGALLNHIPQLSSEADRLLILAWVVTAWLPIPRPILALIGTHGAAKSTVTSFLRRLLDPSRVELLGKDVRGDLPLTFHKHAVPAFDNLDLLAPAESDLFCQAVTGRGIVRRPLYTDDGEFILSFRRSVIVNGLRLPTNRADFLDRCLILDLDRIPTERRASIRQVEGEFEAARPGIVGGILNTLARAMELFPVMRTTGLGRMADFHQWGRAVAVAMGQTEDEFDAAYQVAEGKQKRGASENTLAQGLLLFAKEIGRWEGTPTELYERLIDTARNRQLRRTPEFWPDSPVGLGRLLKQLGETLADYGVAITQLRRKTTRRVLVSYDPAADRLGTEE
jgi:GNAT superfamily N-acetyltransferase